MSLCCVYALQNKMIEDEIRRETREMEEKSVVNDLLLLEVRRLKDLLSAKSDAVFSLENRKQQLVLRYVPYDAMLYALSLCVYGVVLCYGAIFIISMEERKQEISVHRDILKAELKVLNDDRHNITMELRSRQANVDRLKARFDSVARSETEETHSQAYYIIKAAQKREELQRKGM